MSFPDSAASNAANAQPSAQETQRLIALLGNLMPLLLRIQSQAVEPPSPFAAAESAARKSDPRSAGGYEPGGRHHRQFAAHTVCLSRNLCRTISRPE